jgi:hypothetical protein
MVVELETGFFDKRRGLRFLSNGEIDGTIIAGVGERSGSV